MSAPRLHATAPQLCQAARLLQLANHQVDVARKRCAQAAVSGQKSKMARLASELASAEAIAEQAARNLTATASDSAQKAPGAAEKAATVLTLAYVGISNAIDAGYLDHPWYRAYVCMTGTFL